MVLQGRATKGQSVSLVWSLSKKKKRFTALRPLETICDLLSEYFNMMTERK